jgi:HK97 family phage prohead protease
MNKVTKTFDGAIDDVNVGKREVVAVISTDAIDRDGEVVSPKGMKKKHFAGNPVVMVNHDYQTPPVGKALWVKADGNRILAKYTITDKTQLGRDVFALIQDGILSAHSIGFISNYSSKPTTKEVNERPDLKGAKLIHRDWNLLEFSVVGIPANPEALTLAVSKGVVSDETLKCLTYGKCKEGNETAVIEEAITQVESAQSEDLADAIYEAAKRLNVNIDVHQAVEAAFKRFK